MGEKEKEKNFLKRFLFHGSPASSTLPLMVPIDPIEIGGLGIDTSIPSQ